MEKLIILRENPDQTKEFLGTSEGVGLSVKFDDYPTHSKTYGERLWIVELSQKDLKKPLKELVETFERPFSFIHLPFKSTVILASHAAPIEDVLGIPGAREALFRGFDESGRHLEHFKEGKGVCYQLGTLKTTADMITRLDLLKLTEYSNTSAERLFNHLDGRHPALVSTEVPFADTEPDWPQTQLQSTSRFARNPMFDQADKLSAINFADWHARREDNLNSGMKH